MAGSMVRWMLVGVMALSAGRPAAGQSVDLRPLLGPVKHQGERGTCSVHAATSLMEFLIRTRTGSPVDLSEAHNYWTAKSFALRTGFLRRTYSNMDGLAGFLAVEAYRYASMLESEWPYEPRNWQQTGDPRCTSEEGRPANECFTGVPPAGALVLPYRIRPIFVERTGLGQHLLEHRTPLVFNVAWYPAAVDHRTGALRLPTPREQSEREGHVILLVGYDARSREFLFRNSWGPDWGKGGHGTVPERYLVEHCEVAPHLAALEQLEPEVREFVHKASMGVTGELAEPGR